MKNVLRALRQRKFQALAASVIAAGAIAAAVAVPAVAAPASAAKPATVSRCTTSDLRVWMGVPGDGTAGPIYYALELSNISKHACTLYGYPGVSAVGLGGKQLGSPARRNAVVPPHVVTLGRGATAHVSLGIVDPGFFSPSACPRANAIGLRVYPPGATVSTIVPFSFAACGKKGPQFLSVSTVIAGVGIPGYNV
jgi:Protein of unknown function (DUF4232)